ncbi:MAG: GPI anchored serine-threonine rich family protein [Cyclobacteriaceae bacterium]
MTRYIFYVFLVCIAMLSPRAVLLGQAVDSLTEDDIVAIKQRVEQTFQNYQKLMLDLGNPRISKIYQDKDINDSYDLSNSDRIFLNSQVRISRDYDSDFLPPKEPYFNPVKVYLERFFLDYQGQNLDDEVPIYFISNDLSDVKEVEEGLYATILFTSRYGDMIPQERRVTFSIEKNNAQWRAYITSIVFDLPEEEEEEKTIIFSTDSLENTEFEMSVAEQADTLLQIAKFDEAKLLLDSAFKQKPTAQLAALLGQYYEQENNWNEALRFYQQSISLGEAEDANYQNEDTQDRIEELEQLILAETDLDTLPVDSTEESTNKQVAGNFLEVKDTYKIGKEYQVRWDDSGAEPLTLILYRNDQAVKTLQSGLTSSSYIWQVPKNLDKGSNYQFQLSTPMDKLPIESGVFRIKKKTPLGIYIGASVGVGAVLYFLLKPDKPEVDGPQPSEPVENRELDTPPGLPN